MLMESIAGYINSLPRRSRLSTKMMERICVDVFGNNCGVNDMMMAYEAYIPSPTPGKALPEIFQFNSVFF